MKNMIAPSIETARSISMKIIFCVIVMLPNNISAQSKLYRALNSGISKAAAEKIISSDTKIRELNPGLNWGIYRTNIMDTQVNFNLAFTKNDQLQSIYFWSALSFTREEYQTNVPPIIKNFLTNIEGIYGKPTKSHSIPPVDQLRLNNRYMVYEWNRTDKWITITIECQVFQGETEYLPRLNITDTKYVYFENDIGDF